MLIFNCFVSFRYKYLILFVLCPFFLKSPYVTQKIVMPVEYSPILISS